MRTLIWLGMFVGAAAGGYAPVLFGGSVFSLGGLVGNTVGGVLGVLLGYRIARRLDL